MSVKPYTAIMIDENGRSLGIQGNYDYDPIKACHDIEVAYPDRKWRLVALVPGHHMSGVELFHRERHPVVSKDRDVDVWDIPAGTIPPGKAPNCS